jgi:hypothetical protein
VAAVLTARRRRDAVVGMAAAATGIAIALVDSRPSWDDTGITVGALVLSAAAIAFVAGRRPWLWALLVGVPTPLLEVPATHDPAPLVAFALASAGAVAGWAVRRASAADRDARS